MPAGKIHVNLCNPRIKGHVFRPQIIQIYTDYCIDIAYRNVFLQPELASRRDHDIVGRGLKVLDGTGYAGRSCRPTFVLHSVLYDARKDSLIDPCLQIRKRQRFRCGFIFRFDSGDLVLRQYPRRHI